MLKRELAELQQAQRRDDKPRGRSERPPTTLEEARQIKGRSRTGARIELEPQPKADGGEAPR